MVLRALLYNATSLWIACHSPGPRRSRWLSGRLKRGAGTSVGSTWAPFEDEAFRVSIRRISLILLSAGKSVSLDFIDGVRQHLYSLYAAQSFSLID